MKILIDTLLPRDCLLLTRIINVNAKIKNDEGSFDYIRMSFRTKKWKLLRIEVDGDSNVSDGVRYNPFSSSVINTIKGSSKISHRGGVLIEEDGRHRRVIYSCSDIRYESIHYLDRVTDDLYIGQVIRRPQRDDDDFTDDSGWWYLLESNKHHILAMKFHDQSTYLMNAILKNYISTIAVQLNEDGLRFILDYDMKTSRLSFRNGLNNPIEIDEKIIALSKNIIHHLHNK